MSDLSQNGSASLNSEKTLADGQNGERDGSEYLHLLGESIRAARAQRGITRKMLAQDSGVSERFLAQLESGTGNASILLLRQIAQALDMPIEVMLPGANAPRGELARSIELLRALEPAELSRAHEFLLQLSDIAANGRMERVALIGLRGAGKSTVGKFLAQNLQIPFFELDRLIEKESGVSLSMIFDLYGQSGFRRFERRCLEGLLRRERQFVLATGGSLVSEPATYDLLLTTCFTIWLKATPQEHMSRVIAQGDMRPMANNPEAMSDLERILAERDLLYRKADIAIDTSARSVHEVLQECLRSLGQPEPFAVAKG